MLARCVRGFERTTLPGCMGTRAALLVRIFNSSALRLRLLRIHRLPAPAGRRQAGRLFESAGEVALVGKTTIRGDLGKLLFPGQKLALGGVDLALEQVMLGCQAEQFGEASVKMKGAQMNRPGDF